MTTQADPKPTAAEVDAREAAWAAYEAARTAAEAGGWEYDLSMAAADAAKVYNRLKKAAEA
ncbi:MAG: hypothetical protein WAV53_19945 [Anaerolineae bacterium]